jgi:ABC-type multidrug transport system ATPase subunit
MAATYLYDELTGAENLAHYSRLYGLADGGHRARDLSQLVGLEGRLDDRVATYSRGMAQRLSIARAMLHRPAIMLLDEPDSGLDPSATRELRQLLRADGSVDRAIVLTCHDLRLVLTLADDVGVLVDGRFVYAAPVALLTSEGLKQIFAVCARADGALR